MNNIVSGHNVTFKYSEKTVLNEISFSFNKGCTIGVLGENGAGKTTLFDLIYGFLKPSQGEIDLYLDLDNISYLPQVVTLPPALRIIEVFEMMSCFQQLSISQSEMLIKKFWPEVMIRRYEEIKKQRSGVCSYGEKRWFITASMLAVFDKALFILDEPTAGVDVQYRYLIWQLIGKIKKMGKTIVVSSHILDEIGNNTDYFYFLKKSGISRYDGMKDFLGAFNSSTPDEAFIKATVF